VTRLAHRAQRVAVGLIADRFAGEPPASLHPVAWFGTVMQRVEPRVYGDDIEHGAAYTAAGAALGYAAGTVVRDPGIAVALVAAGRELRRVAIAVHDELHRGDLETARSLLPALVGRDPSRLDERGVAAAVIESVAENSVDAVVAPACWALAGGAPGAFMYRAINTMDAMVGHRSSRYAHFGTCSARADDVANWVPARVTALLVAVARPARARRIWQAVREEAPAHPSPNAGVAESAFAGALGVQLGGPLRYADREECRPLLGGAAPRPEPRDIARAVRLANEIELLLVVLLHAIASVA
jgi:adenosylcobinamide-phosphate synthase